MVKLLVNRLKGGSYVGEIHNPAGFSAGLAGYEQLNQKGVSMQACALVAGRHIGQAVRGFNVKFFIDFHTKIPLKTSSIA